MGLFAPNANKAKQIELQNTIFGTSEKKLMVSQDFLNDMTKNYVSKRMKNVNKAAEVVAATKSPRKFFLCYDSMMKDLDELINLEKLHTFKKPTPTEFKRRIAMRKDRYTENMVNRAWKEANQRNNFQAGEKRDKERYGPFLNEMLEFQDRYSAVVLDLIDTFYTSVYDESFRKPHEEELSVQGVLEEIAEEFTEEIGEAEAAEGTPDIDIDDGFLPEDFIQMTE